MSPRRREMMVEPGTECRAIRKCLSARSGRSVLIVELLYHALQLGHWQWEATEMEGKEVDDKEVDDKEVDDKEVDDKEVDDKEVDDKEVDEKEVDKKEIDKKERNGTSIYEIQTPKDMPANASEWTFAKVQFIGRSLDTFYKRASANVQTLNIRRTSRTS
ncbi:hypothetical protein K458DRAFT_384075 [Lentithecium fluviatile CBS 122367]|uniref:Uncharacterized protein n=1 Tax=Lentithecium fluviatile CBS 122367 TaxID=1168545 RepID=A0A6G1JFU0_9PLEO|nr:hypothetical protein K458DRAFT_384075 [Lentithecium fluviatile CBS 122367]